MTIAVQRPLVWSDLVRHSGLGHCDWHVAGVFDSGAGSYSATFHSEPELARFLDFLFASPTKPATSRLYRRASIHPFRPEYDLSNLRFQFDGEHNVAAAVLLADDHKEDRVYQWMTRGTAGRTDVALAHDSWNEHETLFSPESFVTIPQLRAAVTAWAFGDDMPPPAVPWTDVSGIAWF
ncbi:MAG TPA: Imm1 family immunity protein [Pseudonocardiaceae bacterium]|nr:Imm1 family immunity protein [Pseudonocardiaceae bacterium]